MLVLSRKKDEAIILTVPGYPRIKVMVVDIRGDKARIGIEAPEEVEVHREEVQAMVDRERGHRTPPAGLATRGGPTR